MVNAPATSQRLAGGDVRRDLLVGDVGEVHGRRGDRGRDPAGRGVDAGSARCGGRRCGRASRATAPTASAGVGGLAERLAVELQHRVAAQHDRVRRAGRAAPPPRLELGQLERQLGRRAGPRSGPRRPRTRSPPARPPRCAGSRAGRGRRRRAREACRTLVVVTRRQLGDPHQPRAVVLAVLDLAGGPPHAQPASRSPRGWPGCCRTTGPRAASTSAARPAPSPSGPRRGRSARRRRTRGPRRGTAAAAASGCGWGSRRPG